MPDRRFSDIFVVRRPFRRLGYLACFLLIFSCPLGAADSAVQGIPGTLYLKSIPKRPSNAITGSQFARETMNMTCEERDAKALEELRRGNVPDFLRTFKPVCLTYHKPGGGTITAVIYVSPDYLAIGSNKDFLRIPLGFPSAVAVCKAYGCVLPTPKMVDAIYHQSTCHLQPEPMPAGPMMRSTGYLLKYRKKLRIECLRDGCSLGELISGNKKDVVITNRLNRKPGRVAIYGWHEEDGKPIQPLSLFHGKNYADYSHGLRLIYKMAWINGKPCSLIKALQNPRLAPVLTHEGVIEKLHRMLHLNKIQNES